jgi:DNA-binding response OmpR family regulator
MAARLLIHKRMQHRVLVVNTDPATTSQMCEPLRSGGFEVVTAATFDDALHAIRSQPFALLITAERLERHNGLHLVLRARTPHLTPAIVTSPIHSDVLAREAQAFGAMYSVAPWTRPAELLAMVSRIAGAEQV